MDRAQAIAESDVVETCSSYPGQQQASQVVERCCHVGVLWTQYLLLYGQRPHLRLLSLVEFALCHTKWANVNQWSIS